VRDELAEVTAGDSTTAFPSVSALSVVRPRTALAIFKKRSVKSEPDFWSASPSGRSLKRIPGSPFDQIDRITPPLARCQLDVEDGADAMPIDALNETAL
jgi:hypothetical protein